MWEEVYVEWGGGRCEKNPRQKPLEPIRKIAQHGRQAQHSVGIWRRMHDSSSIKIVLQAEPKVLLVWQEIQEPKVLLV